eukprot:8163229-Alexandrium_andersonii.AAC.1
MDIVGFAETLFKDPGRRSSAIAKVIVVLARKMNTDESQTKRLADVAKEISVVQGAATVSRPLRRGQGFHDYLPCPPNRQGGGTDVLRRVAL